VSALRENVKRGGSIKNGNSEMETDPMERQFNGSVDIISNCRICGWAWDAARPADRMKVVALRDGEAFCEALADLVAVGIGDGRHAFDMILSEPLPDTALTGIEIYVKGSDRCLPIAENAIKPQLDCQFNPLTSDSLLKSHHPSNQLLSSITACHWPLVVLLHNSYPHINRGDVFHMWNTTTQKIKEIVDFLARKHDFIDEDYLLTNINNAGALEGKVLLTFDDGYKDIYTELRDFMRFNKVKPILFLVSDALESNSMLWYQKLALAFRNTSKGVVQYKNASFNLVSAENRIALYSSIQARLLSASSGDDFQRELSQALEMLAGSSFDFRLDSDMEFLTLDQIKTLISDGWSVGAHGKTHIPLTCLTPDEIWSELDISKTVLESLFSTTIRSFSYPNGCVNKDILNLTSKIFEIGFLANGEIDDACPLSLPRYEYPSEEARIRSRAPTKEKRRPLASLYINPSETSGIVMPLKTNALRKRGDRGAESRIVMFCGPNHPERYAVSRIASVFNLVGLVVHNYKGFPLCVFKGDPEEAELTEMELALSYESGSARVIFGPTSLAFIVSDECACFQAADINNETVRDTFAALRPDILVVFGTGLVKHRDILGTPIPKINLHWGKSPYYRGSYTLRWPILNRDPAGIAVTVHELTSGIDAGPIYYQQDITLDGSEEVTDIENKASYIGVELIMKLLGEIESGAGVVSSAQDLSKGKLYKVSDWCDEYNAEVSRILQEGFAMRALKPGRGVTKRAIPNRAEAPAKK
jgi:peptidoglycan/xylan/chitin deacetylase (PgdA/CDA1 family)/folate-dependent phosphoribosylglycinamide formyltransferase PurN